MAWEAVISAAKKDTNSVKAIMVDVRYYEKNVPDETLHQKRFLFPEATANGEMRQQIIEEGQRAKKTFDRAAALAAQYPEGTKIAIP
jgi:hypothetical protein